MVINSMQLYLNGNIALVGRNTYGEPVGQIALGYLAGRSCTSVLSGPATSQAVSERGLLQLRERDTIDRNLPGSF